MQICDKDSYQIFATFFTFYFKRFKFIYHRNFITGKGENVFEIGICFFQITFLKVINNFLALHSRPNKLIRIIPFEHPKSESQHIEQETLSIYH